MSETLSYISLRLALAAKTLAWCTLFAGSPEPSLLEYTDFFSLFICMNCILTKLLLPIEPLQTWLWPYRLEALLLSMVERQL